MAMKLSLLPFQSQMYPSYDPLLLTSNLSPKNFRTPNLFPGGRKLEIFKRGANTTRPHEVNFDVYHPLPPQKVEVFKTMEDWVDKNILIHLKPVEQCWQPQDFLPYSTSDEFLEQVKELQDMTKEIPDDYFIVLVGNMITEEALPTYQTRINCTSGVWDETGFSSSPWAIWSRGWTAEENRHGDLLNKYLYLSGRTDMKQIEKTIQYLIASGMNIRTENNPYKSSIYTSFQERATFIAHAITARIAMQHGDTKLAQICGLIAADEKRHETAYTKIAEKLFEIDPNEMVMSFVDMMQNKISMPGQFMYDGNDNHIFVHFTSVASRIGVYSAMDYINILEHLVKKWNVEKLTGLSSEGRKAQDYVCGLAPRLRKLEGRTQQKGAKEEIYAPFNWIFGRQVKL